MTAKVRVYGDVHWSWKTSISNFATIQTVKFDRNQRFCCGIGCKHLNKLLTDKVAHSLMLCLLI